LILEHAAKDFLSRAYIGLQAGLWFLLWVFAGIVAFALLWAGIRLGIHYLRLAYDKKHDYRKHHCADGSPLPPTDRGICDHCRQYFDKVFFFPSGAHICKSCMEKQPNHTLEPLPRKIHPESQK